MHATDNHQTSGAHASLPIGSTVLHRYQVVQIAGTGNFARVYECVDIHSKERVAVKILKKGYERDADFECDVLKGINRCDPTDAQGIVKLVERTEYNGLAVIVFKLKGAPLRSAKIPMSESEIKKIAYDVAQALSFLHFHVKAVHTDLKPENILAELPSSSSAPNARRWSLCDLGSASFYREGQLDRDLITTRPYRAPEVVMNRGWSFPSDAWSLGCILYEIRTGRKLFDCHNDGDHVRMMEDRLGPIPTHLRGSARSSSSFSSRSLGKLADEFRAEPEFLSLLTGLLEYDPTKRLRCDAAMAHPYVTGATLASSRPSLEQAMQLLNVGGNANMENAFVDDRKSTKTLVVPLSSKPAASQHQPSSSGLGLRMPSHANVLSSQAYGSGKPVSLISAPLRQPAAAPHNRRNGDFDYAAVEMKPVLSGTGAFASHSAPGSRSSSPNRDSGAGGLQAPVRSLQSSPKSGRLVSPVYPVQHPSSSHHHHAQPLSYRLTYL